MSDDKHCLIGKDATNRLSSFLEEYGKEVGIKNINTYLD